MGKYDIGKYFQKRVKGYSEEMDTDALWAALDLKEEKEDRGWLFFWYGAGATLLLLAVLFLVDFGNATVKNTTGNLDLNNEPVQELSSDEIAVKEKSNAAIETKINHNEEVFSKSNRAQTEKQSNHILSNLRTNSNNQSSRKIAIGNKKQIAFNAVVDIEDQQQHVATQTESTPTIKEGKAVFSAVEERLRVNATPIKLLSMLPSLDLSQLKSKVGLRLDPNSPIVISANPIVIKGTKWTGALELYSGYYSFNRSLTNLGGTEVQSFINERNESETGLEVIELGVGYRLQNTNGVYLKLGIEYQNINERFDYSKITTDTISIDNVPVEQYINSLGDTSIVTGPGLGSKTDEEKWRLYNQHQIYNLPVNLGYEWSNKSKWSCFAEAGVIFSLKSSFEGAQFDENLNISEPDYISEAFKLGFAGSLGLAYDLSPGFKMFGQARYQKYLDSFTLLSSQIDQQYELYGMRLGITYKIH